MTEKGVRGSNLRGKAIKEKYDKFQCDADVIPQGGQGLLRIQLLGFANDVSDRALLPLIK